MKQEFSIRYCSHWCGPCEKYGDTKTETVIRSNGSILAHRYDHHGRNGCYRVIERAAGSCQVEEAARLYRELSELIHHREQIVPPCDVLATVILEAPGVAIRADAGVSDGKHSCGEVIDSFLASTSLHWELVTHAPVMIHAGEERA